MIRTPAVAGQFYPERKDEVARLLDRYLTPVPDREPAIGVVSPHAGYVFSGAVAGQLFSRVVVPDRVILVGPNHHGSGHPGAVFASGAWRTPLGDMPVDDALAQKILETCPSFSADETAHRREHSLEVQVPFIQHCNPSASFVPICVGHLPLETLVAAGKALAGVIAAADEPILIIASSDMTHFESADAARKKDFMALERVERVDPEGLYRTVRDHRISMCGVLPSVIMLAAARELGARSGTLVAYAHSGEITGDDRDVVGYAGVIVN